MNNDKFMATFRQVVLKLYPDELAIFESIPPDSIEVIASGKADNAKGGDAEFIDVGSIKSMLECIPLMVACYTIARQAASSAQDKIKRRKPTSAELLEMITKSGAMTHTQATAAIDTCRAELETFYL